MKKEWFWRRNLRSALLFLLVFWCLHPVAEPLAIRMLRQEHQQYVASQQQGADMLGAQAREDTPRAFSLADMEGKNLFTCVLEETEDWYMQDIVRLEDGTYYNVLTLESGERVAAQSVKATQHVPLSEDQQTALSQVCRRVPWELDERERTIVERQEMNLSTLDYYLDMGTEMDVDAFLASRMPDRYRLLLAVEALVLLAVWLLGHWYCEQGRPRNELELWLVGPHALWGQQAAATCGKEQLGTSPLRFGGASKAPWGKKWICQRALKGSWGIQDREELLDTVEYMSEGQGFPKDGDPENLAWQLCRSSSLLGMGYVLGWLDRRELVERSCVVGKLIQRHFRSWDDLYQSFLGAYAQFNPGNVQSRVDIYWKLKNRRCTPFSLPWDLPLEPDAGGKAASRSVSKNP